MEPQVAKPELKEMLAAWRLRDESYQPEVAQKRYDVALANWQKAAAEARTAGTTPPRRPMAPVRPREDRNHPANLFNGKIAPLIPYAIRGAIWYQGENNCRPEVANLYRIQLPLLIADWRSRWGEGDFPFAWVQLPNFNTPADRQWPLVREGMLESLSVPFTGMATCLDLGEADDIHPRNKQDVGRRLANWALYTVHGRPRVTSGPLPLKHEARGRDVEVWFRYGDGLKFNGDPEGFEIAGPDGKFVPADVRLGNGSVIFSSPQIESPTHIRYAWSNNPKAVLVNNASLPATPFRLTLKQP
jgi:sialate O-acetylesterase